MRLSRALALMFAVFQRASRARVSAFVPNTRLNPSLIGRPWEVEAFHSIRSSGPRRDQVKLGTPASRSSTTRNSPLIFINASKQRISKLHSTLAEPESTVDNKLFFEGELVSFTSVGKGLGVAAVKVRDDDEGNQSSETLGQKSGDPKNDGGQGGQGDDLIGQAVTFSLTSGPKKGVVVAQRHPVAFVLCSIDSDSSKDEYESATSIDILKEKLKINVSKDLIGKVVDCFGNDYNNDGPMISTNLLSDCTELPIFSSIPKVSEIALINSPMLTGITAIDALTPIGKGQNMLLIGENVDAQRSVLMDIISTQVKEGTKCVYACTSPDDETRSSVLSKLDDLNLSEHIVTVTTRGSTSDSNDAAAAAEAVSVASSACAIAEAFARQSGDDTVVIVDVLNHHKDLWEFTTRTLVDLYGADAVVKADMEGGASSEMRGFYSALIQRAGKFNQKYGNGSITLILHMAIPNEKDVSTDSSQSVFSPEDFEGSSEKIKARIDMLVKKGIPLTSDNLSKIQIPVPVATGEKDNYQLMMQHVDDLISMSDGQIWFTGNEDINTLMLDVQRSITRVGIGADTDSRADAPALQALTGGVRFQLAQALDTIENTKTEADKKEALRKKAWILAMHQNPGKLRTLSEECAVLIAVKCGLIDKIISENEIEVVETVDRMINYVWDNERDEMTHVDKTLDFSDNGRVKLENTIKEFFYSL